MSCILDRPTPAALRAYIQDLFQANVLRGAPIIPESNEWFVVNNDYALAEEYRSFADQLLREFDDTQCCDDTLYQRAASFGVFPSPGSYATGYVQITASTPGAALADDLSVVIRGAGSYQASPYAAGSQTVGADGTVVVLLRATALGSAGNNAANGTTGTILQALAGVNATVNVLPGGFQDGRDAETPDQFRARYLARKAYQPLGNWAWLVKMLQGWPTVTRLCRRTSGACNTGRVEAYAMFDNTFPNGLAPASVNNELGAWLFGSPNGMGLGQAAIGVFGKIFTATASPVNVTISGLGCLTSAQLTRLNGAIAVLFQTLCPEQTLCKRLIEALIVTIAGASCLPVVTISATNAGATISSVGDAVPGADILLTLNQLVMTQ
jgi:hypothetical protein